jgi:hypothetical protein
VPWRGLVRQRRAGRADLWRHLLMAAISAAYRPGPDHVPGGSGRAECRGADPGTAVFLAISLPRLQSHSASGTLFGANRDGSIRPIRGLLYTGRALVDCLTLGQPACQASACRPRRASDSSRRRRTRSLAAVAVSRVVLRCTGWC